MRKSWIVASVPVVAWMAVGVAHAGAANDLRARLSKLQAGKPVHVSVSVRSKVSSGDEDEPRVTHAHVRFRLRADDGQLQVTYPAKLMRRVDAGSAAHAKDPDVAQPVQALLGSFGPLRARMLVDFAPPLLRRLEGATLQSQRDDTYDGKPARLLVFNLPPGVASRNRDDIDAYDGHLKVWLGVDGVPVAVSGVRHYEGSKFFIDFEFGSSMSAALRQVGRRLVAVRYRYQSSSSGMGQRQSRDTHVELVVDDGAAKVVSTPDPQ